MLRISNKGLPVHSLYLGSRDGKAFSDVDRQSVTEVVGNSFDCSTFIDASGHFQGRSVATLLINIATDDGASVEELARSLGKLLDQRVVGIETAGIYRSIYMG